MLVNLLLPSLTGQVCLGRVNFQVRWVQSVQPEVMPPTQGRTVHCGSRNYFLQLQEEAEDNLCATSLQVTKAKGKENRAESTGAPGGQRLWDHGICSTCDYRCIPPHLANFFSCKMGSCYFAQFGLKLLASNNLPASPSQNVEITGLSISTLQTQPFCVATFFSYGKIY
ncbi:hypothetical protein AAY473_023347 [Plecturocebus cupreus]